MNVELLEKVKQHILEEPKRFLMDTFIDRADETNRMVWDGDAPNVPEHPFPKCGTAACIAGWSILLMNDKKYGAGNIRERAESLLAINTEQANRLFYTDEWPASFLEGYENATTPAEKVGIAARRIDHFVATQGAE